MISLVGQLKRYAGIHFDHWHLSLLTEVDTVADQTMENQRLALIKEAFSEQKTYQFEQLERDLRLCRTEEARH